MNKIKQLFCTLIALAAISCGSNKPEDPVIAVFEKMETTAERLSDKGVILNLDKVIYDDRLEEEKRIAVTEYGDFIKDVYCKNGMELITTDLEDICLGFKYISVESFLSKRKNSIARFEYIETFVLEEGNMAIVAYKAYPKSGGEGHNERYFVRKIGGKWKIDDDAFEYELAIMKYNQYLKSKEEGKNK